MHEKAKVIIRILIFILLVVCATVFFNNRKSNSLKTEMSRSYNGIIEKIRSDQKRIYFITVNGKEIYLNNYPIRESYSNLQVGDSLNKEKGSNSLKHFKKSKKGYYFYASYKIK